MKLISTPKLLLMAFATTMLFSCSVNDDEQLENNKSIEPQTEQMSKSADSTYAEGEPMIPKPRG